MISKPVGERTFGLGLGLLFFLVSFSLGYPVLNRYDPAEASGTSDAAFYAQLVTRSPAEVEGHWGQRILVPYLARGVLRVVGRAPGSWDSVNVALLVVNSGFTAGSGLLIFTLGRAVVSAAAGLIAGILFLVNFNVANVHLAGHVDAAEACLLLALVCVLTWPRRWWLIFPFLGALGPLAKETYVPLSLAMVAAWLATRVWTGEGKLLQAIQMGSVWAAGLVAGLVLRAWLTADQRMPWQIASEEMGTDGLLISLWRCLVDRGLWYGFIWLLPLAVWHLGKLPRPWCAAAAAGVSAALFLGAWHGSGGNVGRAAFNVAGPLLCVSAASWLLAQAPSGSQATASSKASSRGPTASRE